NVWILLAQKVQRLVVEKLERACVGALPRSRNERQHVRFICEKYDATQQTFGFRQQLDFDLADHTECAFAADKQIDGIHFRRDEIAACVLARRGHAVIRKRQLDRFTDVESSVRVSAHFATSQIDDFTGGKNDFQSSNVITAWAILERPGAGGVSGDITADE